MLCRSRRYWKCRINKRFLVELYMFLISYISGVWWVSNFTTTCPEPRRDFFRYNHHEPIHLKYGESFSNYPENTTKSDEYSLLIRYKHVCNLYGLKIKLTHLPDIYNDCEWLVWFPESSYQHPSMFGAILNQLDYNMPIMITTNGLNYKIKYHTKGLNDVIMSGDMMAISLGLLYTLTEMGEYTANSPENLILDSLHESFGKSLLLYWREVQDGFKEKTYCQNLSATFEMAKQQPTERLIPTRQNLLEARIKQLIQKSAFLNQEILTMESILNLRKIYGVKKAEKPLLIPLQGADKQILEYVKSRKYIWPTHSTSWRPDKPAFNFASLSNSWICFNHGKVYSLRGLPQMRTINSLQTGALKHVIESSGLMEYGSKFLNTANILFYNAYQRVDPIYGAYFNLILRGRTSKRKKYRYLSALLAVPFGVAQMKAEVLTFTQSPKNKSNWLPYYLQPTNMLYKLMPTQVSASNPRTYTSNDRFVFIVPLYGRYEAMLTFMKNYEDKFLSSKNLLSLNVVLLVVLFDDSLADYPQANNIATLLQSYRDTYGYYTIEIMYTHHTTFSRGRGLDLGIRKLHSNDIAFFVDVDMTISSAMVTTCRRNVQKGYNVWFPVAYSQYNPKYTCNYVDQGNETYRDEDLGFWRIYGYGMACLYKADYLMAGGFDLSIRGWGYEDVDLCRSAIKHNLQIFRSNQFDLIHIYHDKHCDRSLPGQKLTSCVSTRFGHYASMRCLARNYEQKIKNR